jgi:hypothetical protein
LGSRCGQTATAVISGSLIPSASWVDFMLPPPASGTDAPGHPRLKCSQRLPDRTIILVQASC